MPVNAVMNPADPRLYNPSRDVAHNFPDVARVLAARLDGGAWTALEALLIEKKVTTDELGQAVETFCGFVVTAADNPKETMSGTLARSGFEACREEAKIAVMAMLGTVILGYYWAGVREVTIVGDGSCMTYKDLQDAGAEAHRLIMVPKWRRRLRSVKRWLSAIWNSLRGR